MSTLDCVLVMPAYNEEGCVAQVIADWSSELTALLANRFQIVVVNDGSKDRTGNILDSLARDNAHLTVIHQPNAGHGNALWRAYQNAAALDTETIFHVDSDDQFQPSDFRLLWENRKKSPFILGRRQQRQDPFHRLVITTVLRYLLWLVFGVNIRDANIPFRLIQRHYLATQLAVLPEGLFAPNIFLSLLAALDGQHLLHTSVHHKKRSTGKVSIVHWRLMKVCFRCFREVCLFRFGMARAVLRLKQVSVA